MEVLDLMAFRGQIPHGIICMWHGALASVPPGWHICDGTNGTPDLRDKFVLGAGNTYNPADTGGATSATLTEANIPQHDHGSAGSHTHDTIANHTHEVYRSETAEAGTSRYILAAGTSNAYTSSWAGGHTHSNTGTAHTHNNYGQAIPTAVATLPPYYALAYIMKL